MTNIRLVSSGGGNEELVEGFGGGGGRGGGSTDAAQIGAWAQARFKAETVGGMTVYNLITSDAGQCRV
jgi:hypothetical protein